MPDLSVIIVSFNTRDLTLACLRSVFDQTRATSFEVIVADNASTDGSPDAIATEFPTVRLLGLDTNIGFARANNLAAKEALGSRLLLLNPDTVILDAAIDRAVTFANQQHDDAILGGRTFFPDGRLNHNSCHGRPTPWSLICMGLGLSSIFRRSRWFDPESLGRWQRDTVREVDAVSGCFLLIGRELWQRLDGFDESFFMYGEDTDLCLRARELGARCVICPDARLVHHGAASDRVRPDKMVRLFRAKVQLIRKHWSPRTRWLGPRLLAMWAFTRMVALAGLGVVRPARRSGFRAWREVWRRRREFALPAAP